MSQMVEIIQDDYDVILDIKYASTDNFTGKPVYKRAACFIHEVAAEKLSHSIFLAKKQNFKIKIFDAFRPLEAQQALWNHTPDENFLSNPETGSVPHCRGVAIDLTLVDTNGNELDMGTEFDEFTPKSHHGNTEISETAQNNRLILMDIMTKSGWDHYINEWWHYQLFKCRQYPRMMNSIETNLV